MDENTKSLLLIPTDDAVVFPGSTITIAADVGDEERVFLVPRHENDFASVGTVAEVLETTRLPGGQIAATVEGLHRAQAGAARNADDGSLRVDATAHPDEAPSDERTRELTREYRAV